MSIVIGNNVIDNMVANAPLTNIIEVEKYIPVLGQYFSNSIVFLPVESPQSCTQPQIWYLPYILQLMYQKIQATHLPLDKMATILADNNFKCIFFNENHSIPIPISLKFLPRSPIGNKPAWV